MISMYQKPQISFKASSCNSVYFFFHGATKKPQTNQNKTPKQTNKNKKTTTKKAPHPCLSPNVDKTAKSHFSEKLLCRQE